MEVYKIADVKDLIAKDKSNGLIVASEGFGISLKVAKGYKGTSTGEVQRIEFPFKSEHKDFKGKTGVLYLLQVEYEQETIGVPVPAAKIELFDAGEPVVFDVVIIKEQKRTQLADEQDVDVNAPKKYSDAELDEFEAELTELETQLPTLTRTKKATATARIAELKAILDSVEA